MLIKKKNNGWDVFFCLNGRRKIWYFGEWINIIIYDNMVVFCVVILNFIFVEMR